MVPHAREGAATDTVGGRDCGKEPKIAWRLLSDRTKPMSVLDRVGVGVFVVDYIIGAVVGYTVG